MSISPNLSQPGVGDAEVVGDFVPDHPGDFGDDFLIGTADGFDGLLKDGDFVGQYHAITTGSSGARHTFVKAEQSLIGFQAGFTALVRRGIVLDDDFDVFQSVEEFLRQAFDGEVYQLFEFFSFQLITLSVVLRPG